jgi:hypothetical protein
MRVVDIVGVRGLLATRNRAEIEALDVERVASGYLRAVEDDRPDAACRRVSRGTSCSPSRITRNTVDMMSSLAAFSICGRYRH